MDPTTTGTAALRWWRHRHPHHPEQQPDPYVLEQELELWRGFCWGTIYGAACGTILGIILGRALR